MNRGTKQFVGVVCLMMLLAGCATQRYGRLVPLAESEGENFSCKQIAIEMDKCNVFIQEVTAKNRKFTAKDVLSFGLDWGIGDSWEVTDALASATDRLKQLQRFKAKKQCNSLTVPAYFFE